MLLGYVLLFGKLFPWEISYTQVPLLFPRFFFTLTNLNDRHDFHINNNNDDNFKSSFKSILLWQMKIKFIYENNCLLVIFCGWMESQKLNAKIKMLSFGSQIAKISNRRKCPLYSIRFAYFIFSIDGLELTKYVMKFSILYLVNTYSSVCTHWIWNSHAHWMLF